MKDALNTKQDLVFAGQMHVPNLGFSSRFTCIFFRSVSLPFMRGIEPLTPMEMATKVVVFIFIEFQDYNGSMKRLWIYNFNGIVYKFNTND